MAPKEPTLLLPDQCPSLALPLATYSPFSASPPPSRHHLAPFAFPDLPGGPGSSRVHRPPQATGCRIIGERATDEQPQCPLPDLRAALSSPAACRLKANATSGPTAYKLTAPRTGTGLDSLAPRRRASLTLIPSEVHGMRCAPKNLAGCGSLGGTGPTSAELAEAAAKLNLASYAAVPSAKEDPMLTVAPLWGNGSEDAPGSPGSSLQNKFPDLPRAFPDLPGAVAPLPGTHLAPPFLGRRATEPSATTSPTTPTDVPAPSPPSAPSTPSAHSPRHHALGQGNLLLGDASCWPRGNRVDSPSLPSAENPHQATPPPAAAARPHSHERRASADWGISTSSDSAVTLVGACQPGSLGHSEGNVARQVMVGSTKRGSCKQSSSQVLGGPSKSPLSSGSLPPLHPGSTNPSTRAPSASSGHDDLMSAQACEGSLPPSVCVNFEEVEALCMAKDLEKDYLTGIRILPANPEDPVSSKVELIQYALFFSSSAKPSNNFQGQPVVPPMSLPPLPKRPGLEPRTSESDEIWSEEEQEETEDDEGLWLEDSFAPNLPFATYPEVKV